MKCCWESRSASALRSPLLNGKKNFRLRFPLEETVRMNVGWIEQACRDQWQVLFNRLDSECSCSIKCRT
jgi:hypothetical protein